MALGDRVLGPDGRSVLTVGAVVFAVGWLPLFAGPGYEYALALGLLLPASVCVLSCHRGAHLAPTVRTQQAWHGSMLLALRLFTVAVLVAMVHGVRVGFCDVWGGLELLLLGPGVGTVLGACVGTFVGWGARRLGYRGRWLAAAALCLPTLTVLTSIVRFYTSPMVFAFDPFVGFFSGSFYDTVIDPAERLLSYRIGSIGLALAFSAAAGGVVGSASKARWVCVAAGAALQGWISWQGPELGHFQTPNSIEASLGRRLDGKRCSVVFDRSIGEKRAELLLRECAGAIQQAEGFFETEYGGHLLVYAFRSAQQKGWLMGASATYIAKPWRHEIYIQDQPFPHRVLPHEVAHVVAGAFARGPFRVAGPLGGWIPDPGRIEGFAVAAAPPDDTDFSLEEWCSALLRLDQLPRLDSLFRLSFLGHNSSKAYTVAGAFIRFLREQLGAAVLRQWYAGVRLDVAAGSVSLPGLAEQFRERLRAIPVSERTMDLARDRFQRPALFGRTCPHEVDGLLMDADSLLSQGKVQQARSLYEEVLALDEQSFSARLGLARCSSPGGRRVPQEVEALRGLLALPGITTPQRATLSERLGDRLLAQGKRHEADAAYSEALPLSRNENRRRALDVKRYAAQHEEAGAIVQLLIGSEELHRDELLGGAALGRWSESQPDLGLADYLLAKNYFGRGLYPAASDSLERATGRRLPLASVRAEASRLAVLIECTRDDLQRLPALSTVYAENEDVPAARREGLSRLVHRCRVGAEEARR